MKRLFAVLAVVLLSATMWAQNPPQKMSYQAVIRDADRKLVITQVGMRISILQGSETGTPSYVETQTPMPNANGLVSIEIGTGTTTDDFSAINWANGPYYIKTEIDPDNSDGLTDYTIFGTSQILSVPYAMYAKTAASYTETDPNAVLLTGEQTVAGNKTFIGTTTVPTPVNSTDAVTKAYVDELKTQIEELQLAADNKVKDIDENVYKSVIIGTQVWMAENLKTTKYNDGTPIPNITDNIAWEALTTGAYSDYNNTPSNSTTYGRLYNWYAIDNNAATKVASNGDKNVCPTGWHIPSDIEWTRLTDYLTNHGYGYEGSGVDIAKSMAATSGWTTYGTPGTVGNDQASNNSSGFTALPSVGYRFGEGSFSTVGGSGDWWSATVSSALSAWNRGLYYSTSNVVRDYDLKKYGFSVRCVRD